MEATLGAGWESLFDLKLAACMKPAFFLDHEKPLYPLDPNSKNFLGEPISDIN
jgi:hypothetical protein